jgi:hypothetical protein
MVFSYYLGVGGVLGKVGQILNPGQSLNLIIEMNKCGPLSFASSVPFGESGKTFNINELRELN